MSVWVKLSESEVRNDMNIEQVYCTCGVVTLNVVPLVGVDARGVMLFCAWARACWGTMTSWPISVLTRTIPDTNTHKNTSLQTRFSLCHILSITCLFIVLLFVLFNLTDYVFTYIFFHLHFSCTANSIYMFHTIMYCNV